MCVPSSYQDLLLDIFFRLRMAGVLICTSCKQDVDAVEMWVFSFFDKAGYFGECLLSTLREKVCVPTS